MDKHYNGKSFTDIVMCKDSTKLRMFIEHIPPKQVTSWKDEHGLDVMHHLILANNTEMVEYLLKHGFFVRPYTPDINPYSHLAALLGERTLLQVLLQHRPDDFCDLKVPIQLPEKVLEKLSREDKYSVNVSLQLSRSSNGFSNSSVSPSSSNVLKVSSSSYGTSHYQIESLSTLLRNLKQTPGAFSSPLELSARAGHLDCVCIILNQCVLKKCSEVTLVDKSDFTLASFADSPQSLALLLHHKSPTRAEWEAALTVCLHQVHPDCLDILLHHGRDPTHMFKGVNFFHVLYTSANKSRSYPRLAQATEVLIKHGHDVMARSPCRTYPMYSLLTNSFCFHDYDNTQHYVKALRVLLKHGANPNFDEVKMEKLQPKKTATKTIGRPAFSSALHCLLQTAESTAQYLDSPALAVKFVEDVAGVLRSSKKVSMNHIGYLGDPENMNMRGSALHQLAKSSVTMGVNPAMVKCVLRHGADPNLKVDGKYPINIYTDRLFQRMRALEIVDLKMQHMQDAMTMCRLCRYMTLSAIRECLAIFIRDHGKERSQQIQPYVNAVKEELSIESRQIRRLRDTSAWAVWVACGCHFERVNKLKVSSEIKTYILPLTF